jgi:phosphoribosylformylglycinamidine synthase subunit PurS
LVRLECPNVTFVRPDLVRDSARADRYSAGGPEQQGAPVARVVVDVMLKPEILDPQGQAIAQALPRLGFTDGAQVRAGKHFVLDFPDDVSEQRIREIADTLLANPVIEDFEIRQ